MPSEAQLTGIMGILGPQKTETLGCFHLPTSRLLIHSAPCPPFLPGFFLNSGKFHRNVCCQPLCSSLPQKGSIGISQTWQVPTWVLGYICHFGVLCLSPGLIKQASQGWGKELGKLLVVESDSWSMSSPFTHPLNFVPSTYDPVRCLPRVLLI